MDYDLLKLLGISLGLGLLVGLQREYDEHQIAGIRTFALVTLFGSIMGLLSQYFSSALIVAAGAIAIGFILVIANYRKSQSNKSDLGQTTEVAIMLMYGVGAYLIIGKSNIAIAIGAVTAVLLQLKSVLGGFVKRLEPKDITGIMEFAAISLIILPILPDRTFGPYDVINPREAWLMVVLIVGLGLIGYFIYKLLGKNAGTIANGILGGMISSTAATVTFARRASSVPKGTRLAAFIILTASTVAVARVIIEVAVVTPDNLHIIAPPLIVEFIFMSVLSAGLYYYNQDKETKELPEPDNPAQLKSALIFGTLYVVIIFAVAAAKDYFGQSGLYAISIISGFTDVDAITLSLSNSLNRGDLSTQLAWKLILIATLSNLVFKGSLALILGTRKLSRYVWLTFGISIIAGLLIVWLWPENWHF